MSHETHRTGESANQEPVIKSASELVKMGDTEFREYSNRAEAAFDPHEAELIDGQDIDRVLATRGEMDEGADRAVKAKAEAIKGQHNLFVGKDDDQVELDSNLLRRFLMSKELHDRAADLAVTLYGDRRHDNEGGLGEKEYRELLNHTVEILTMPVGQFEELAAKWIQLEEVHQADVRRRAEEEARHKAEDETPIFDKLKSEYKPRHNREDNEAAAAKAVKAAVVAQTAPSKNPSKHSNGSGDRPQIEKTPEKMGAQVVLTDAEGGTVSRTITARGTDKEGNQRIWVRETKLGPDGKQHGPTHEYLLDNEYSTIMLDMSKDAYAQIPTERKPVNLTVAEYEQKYGPMGTKTGDSIAIARGDDGSPAKRIVIDPLRKHDGRLLPRTVSIYVFDESGKIIQRELSTDNYDRERLALDWARYFAHNKDYLKNGHSPERPMPREEWEEIGAALNQKRAEKAHQEALDREEAARKAELARPADLRQIVGNGTEHVNHFVPDEPDSEVGTWVTRTVVTKGDTVLTIREQRVRNDGGGSSVETYNKDDKAPADREWLKFFVNELIMNRRKHGQQGRHKP